MSRIQNILDKAEREGTALRTSRLTAATPMPAAQAQVPVTPMPASPAAPMAPITAISPGAVPVTIEIPTPPSVIDAPAIVPGAPSVNASTHAAVTTAAAPEIE